MVPFSDPAGVPSGSVSAMSTWVPVTDPAIVRSPQLPLRRAPSTFSATRAYWGSAVGVVLTRAM